MPANVFLSVGHALTPGQKQFVDAVVILLKAHELVPRTVGRTDFADRRPLHRIAEVMKVCSGTIVLALRRIHIAEGTELHPTSSASRLADVNLPTVWNQIEAAMAYSLDQPLLAIVEPGLRNEGVLEEGYDWYVKWLDLGLESLSEPGFLKTFAAWKTNVMRYQEEHFRREN